MQLFRKHGQVPGIKEKKDKPRGAKTLHRKRKSESLENKFKNKKNNTGIQPKIHKSQGGEKAWLREEHKFKFKKNSHNFLRGKAQILVEKRDS